VLIVLWVVESLEPESRKTFELKITASDPEEVLRYKVENILRRFDVKYELRSAGAKDLVYEAQLPITVRTDRIANEVLRLKSEGDTEVTWEEKKKK
jgi:hypothetical protein